MILPVECSEINNNHLLTEDETGYIFNGIYSEYTYGIAEYPETRIYIKNSDDEIIDINKVTDYFYKLKAYNENHEYLNDINTSGDIDIDYFSYTVENVDYPIIRYFELVKVNGTDYTETVYEIENNKITYNRYADKGYIEIYFILANNEDPEKEDKTVLNALLYLIEEFFINFIDNMSEALTNFTNFLLKPDDAMMNTIQDTMENKIIVHLPILKVPYEVLDALANGYDQVLLEQDKTGIPDWNNLYLPGYEEYKPLIQGGSFNWNDFIEEHEGFIKITETIKTITSGIFALLFVEYLKSKFNQLF